MPAGNRDERETRSQNRRCQVSMKTLFAAIAVAAAAAAQEDRPGDPQSTAFDWNGGVAFISIIDTAGDPMRPGNPESPGRYLYGSVRITHRVDEFVPEPGRACERWSWSSGGTPVAVSGSRTCYQVDMPNGCESSDGYELFHYVDSWAVLEGNVAIYFTETVYEWDLYCRGRFIHP